MCIGAIVTYDALTPVVTITNGKAHIIPADGSLQNIVVRVGFKTVIVTGYNPALGNTTVDIHFTMFMAFTVDSLAIGGMDPNNTIFAGVGAGNCVFLSDGIYTVDDGAGNIQIRSDQDHLWYTAHINYATGEVTFTTPPPDGTMLYRPTA